jgi:hypothetical protein
MNAPMRLAIASVLFALAATTTLASTPRYPDVPADWVVTLRDGTTIHSTRAPLVAFGKVRAHGPEGEIVLDASAVDMERSKAQWVKRACWVSLDTAHIQSKPFPPSRARRMDGQVGDVVLPAKNLVYVDAWASY